MLIKELRLDSTTLNVCASQNGEAVQPRSWHFAPTSLQLALARGHRWLALCLNQEGCTLREHATCEGVDNSYVSRIVNLTTLPPDIVAAILGDALLNHLTLFDLVVNPPALWEEQRERIGGLIASYKVGH